MVDATPDPTLPCHAPLTLYAKNVKEEEEQNEGAEHEQPEKESPFSLRLIMTKHRDYTSEDPDDTHRCATPFDSSNHLSIQQGSLPILGGDWCC